MRSSYSAPLSISGAIQKGLPTTLHFFERVRFFSIFRVFASLRLADISQLSSGRVHRARPKSATTTEPS